MKTTSRMFSRLLLTAAMALLCPAITLAQPHAIDLGIPNPTSSPIRSIPVDAGGFLTFSYPSSQNQTQVTRFDASANPVWSRIYPVPNMTKPAQRGSHWYAIMGTPADHIDIARFNLSDGTMDAQIRVQSASMSGQGYQENIAEDLAIHADGRVISKMGRMGIPYLGNGPYGYLEINSAFSSANLVEMPVPNTAEFYTSLSSATCVDAQGHTYLAVESNNICGTNQGLIIQRHNAANAISGKTGFCHPGTDLGIIDILFRNGQLFVLYIDLPLNYYIASFSPDLSTLNWNRKISGGAVSLCKQTVSDNLLYLYGGNHQLIIDNNGNLIAQGTVSTSAPTTAATGTAGRIYADGAQAFLADPSANLYCSIGTCRSLLSATSSTHQPGSSVYFAVAGTFSNPALISGTATSLPSPSNLCTATLGNGSPDVVAFTHSATNLLVSFSNTSTLLGTNAYHWDFGDGNTSTASNPSHTYAAPGTYTVCLSSTGGCVSTTTCQTITVACPLPVANWTHTANGLAVAFSNTSTGASTYLWTFGTGASSTATNPSYTYPSQGTYTVCLTATNACGSDQECRPITVRRKRGASYAGPGGDNPARAAQPAILTPDIQTYPNPAQDHLMIQATAPDGETIHARLLNTVGQTVWQGEVHGSESHRIDTRALPAGIYWLRWQSGEATGTRKVLLTH